MLFSIDVFNNIKVKYSNNENKTIKKLSFYQKLITKAIDYLMPNIKIAFIQLIKAFIKALIFCSYNLESYIWIKINFFDYNIGIVLSQIIINNWAQWQLIANFLKKKILVKT